VKPIIILDSGPLGLLMQRRSLSIADRCRAWLSGRISQGAQCLVPEIADYEVRRELIRMTSVAAIGRLDAFNAALPGRYLPLTTAIMRQAAALWADVRQRGFPTADAKELDGDVIVAAQAMGCPFPPGDVIVATTNPVHLARFPAADLWTNL
jgi:hypothetical protein